VAYALAGTIDIDLSTEPLASTTTASRFYLKDLWPTDAEVAESVRASLTPEMFKERYASALAATNAGQNVPTTNTVTYNWDPASTYVKLPPYFDGLTMEPGVVENISGSARTRQTR